MEPATVKEMTEYVLKELLKYHSVKFTEVAPFWDQVRFDIFTLRSKDRQGRIYEVKSCRSDFAADKKWQKYLPYCTRFAFVCPPGTIKPEELPPRIGLIEVYRNGDGLTHRYVKKMQRLRERIPDQEYIQLLEGIVWRYGE